jgi:hypothetical protein
MFKLIRTTTKIRLMTEDLRDNFCNEGGAATSDPAFSGI